MRSLAMRVRAKFALYKRQSSRKLFTLQNLLRPFEFNFHKFDISITTVKKVQKAFFFKQQLMKMCDVVSDELYHLKEFLN